jgi:glyoxylase-like metal-dependent hydrolase (beta-lactamase superfamily II)
MSLEDHAGDILHKARVHAGLGLAEVAQAAGLSPGELETLEATGYLPKPAPYSALAARLGLSAAKLERVAGGWSPAPVDLSLWRELRVIPTSGGGYSVNAFLVWDEVTREAALFDTGFDAGPVLELIEANELQLKHIFITHGHGDHIGGLAAVRQYHPKARPHSGDRNAPPDQRYRANEFIHLGSLRITNRETPGHADDGVTYIVGTWPEDAPHVAIVGDALFAGSVGKAPGKAALALQKIREQILTLPPDTLLCPGHGPLTTIAEEKANNPFL